MEPTLSKPEIRSPKAEIRRPKKKSRENCPEFLGSLSAVKRSKASQEKIRAVTFDVGGTLIECWPSVGHIYAKAAVDSGHPSISPAALNRRFKSAWRKFEGFGHTRAEWSALVDETFRGLIEPLPSQTFFHELFDRFSQPEAWRVFADVVPTLNALRGRGLNLAIISNWDDRLRPLLKRLDLDQYFQTIIVSCEAGARKPARQIFESACAALGTEPAGILHVGDSQEMDLKGALAAGLRALWLRRGTRTCLGKAIGSLRELDKI
jgi:putative hydrolase of the HAD superfamily